MEFIDRYIDSVDHGVALLGPSGRVLFANPAARQMLGLGDRPADGTVAIEDYAELYPPKFWKEQLARMEVMVKHGGLELHLLASTFPGPDGTVLLLEPEPRHAEDDFRYVIMDAMDEGVLVLDEEGGVQYMNTAAKRILRIPWHKGQDTLWSMDNLGEFQPKDFWRTKCVKREVTLQRDNATFRLLASSYPRDDRFLVCFDQQEREPLWHVADADKAKAGLHQLVGITPDIRREAMILASTDLSFLITGESGTGKEVMARAIHFSSHRAAEPFVVIDCTSLPESLIESELFGYEPGSFTGARSDGRSGKFELADRGTVMLDEVADLPLALQPKLLRVLNDQMVTRIGARKPKQVDVRVVACTNRDLGELVLEGRFRADLYYRLKGAVLRLPPLRERMQHLDELAELFLKEWGRGLKCALSAGARAALHAHQWPGNIRELEKVLQYMVARCQDGDLDLRHLPAELQPAEGLPVDGTYREIMLQHERDLLNRALAASGGSVARAALALGLSEWGLRIKMRKCGIAAGRARVARIPGRLGRGNRASLKILSAAPNRAKPGQELAVHLAVTNLGRNPWLDIGRGHRQRTGKYYVEGYWIRMPDVSRNHSMFHLPLPGPVKPGETVEVRDAVAAPAEPGEYFLVFSMTHSGVSAFLERTLISPPYAFKHFPKVGITVAR